MVKILDSECQECIKLYGHEEMRCAFCEEKDYYRDGLIGDQEIKIQRKEELEKLGIRELSRTITYLTNLIEKRFVICWNEAQGNIIIEARNILSKWKEVIQKL